jgi:hypothetical protein
MAAHEHAQATGQTPLDYLLAFMRNEEKPDRMRLTAASIAVNFCHVRLNANFNANVTSAPNSDARARLEALLTRLAQPLVELAPATVDASKVTDAEVIELPKSRPK